MRIRVDYMNPNLYLPLIKPLQQINKEYVASSHKSERKVEKTITSKNYSPQGNKIDTKI